MLQKDSIQTNHWGEVSVDLSMGKDLKNKPEGLEVKI